MIKNQFIELYKNYDNTKHIFQWRTDIMWDNDGRVNIPETKYMSTPTNEESNIYMEAINNAFEECNYPEKVIKVYTLNSSAGGWPECLVRSTTPMTIKEFIYFFSEYCGDCNDSLDSVIYAQETYNIEVIN